MGRKLLGYRGRATHEGKYVYADHVDGTFCWSEYPPLPQERKSCEFETAQTKEHSVDVEGNPIEVSCVKIVAVYLRTDREIRTIDDPELCALYSTAREVCAAWMVETVAKMDGKIEELRQRTERLASRVGEG